MNAARSIGLVGLLLPLGSPVLRGQPSAKFMHIETQLTHRPQGHTLHNTQVFSPDDQWIVYDTRNDGTHIARTGFIEKIHVRSGEVVRLYQTTGQTSHGPGVGAATYNPLAPQVLFIHGLRNSSAQRPYGFTRRSGVLVDERQPGVPHFLDARTLRPPFRPGALRGGTHAHTWSGDGRWISFTYNDFILEQLEKRDSSVRHPSVRDLRVVGVMAPAGPVRVEPDADGEHHDGEWFAVVVTRVTERPRPGSDDIDRAFDEGWIGKNGYLKPDGTRQARAIAFQGTVRNAEGQPVTEVFVADLPPDVTIATPGAPLEGSATTRPAPPAGTTQRRVTFSAERPSASIQGPRHWLRSSPDGRLIFFLMNDARGVAQIHAVSPNGGEIRAITAHPFLIQTPFNVSPDGQRIAYGADNSVFVTELATGKSIRLTPRSGDEARPENGVVWSNDGTMLAYNRYVNGPDGRFLQVFLLR